MRFIFLLLLISASALSQTSEMAKIQNQYFGYHVPEADVFDEYLVRDLNRYFSRLLKRKNITLSYQLLRSTPTRTQTSKAEFYLWIEVSLSRRPKAHGVVKVAAIAGAEFEVLEFLSASELRSDPGIMVIDYPYEVRESINDLLYYSNQSVSCVKGCQ